MSTHPLCEAALAGNTFGFGAAYDRYAPVLYGLLVRILGSTDDAQEILQETFLAAWTNARTFDASRGSELGWLIAMARSRGIDRLRARDRRELREQEAVREIPIATTSVDSSGNDPAVFNEIRSAVRVALKQLPEAQRTTLELAYFEGCSQSEIAARLGVPLGTIKTRTLLGMKRLRERLGAFRQR